MKFLKISSLKVEWSNHIIGFVSTLLGIFIAFQLDDWQEERKRQEQIQITLEAIKKEIDRNIEVYQANAGLSDFAEGIQFVMNHTRKNEFVVTEKELSIYRKKLPGRFDSLKLVTKRNDSLFVYQAIEIHIDILPKTGISTNNWEAAKASGILNFIDHYRMVTLTEIYDWTTKDLGFNESEFYKRNLLNEVEIVDVNNLLADYSRVARFSQFKLKRIEQAYQSMNWEVD